MQRLIRGKIFKPTIIPHIISYKKNHPLVLEPIVQGRNFGGGGGARGPGPPRPQEEKGKK